MPHYAVRRWQHLAPELPVTFSLVVNQKLPVAILYTILTLQDINSKVQ